MNEDEADKTLTFGACASFISGIILTLMGFIFLDALINSMATPTIFPYAKIYATYILVSGPVLAVSCVLNNACIRLRMTNMKSLQIDRKIRILRHLTLTRDRMVPLF